MAYFVANDGGLHIMQFSSSGVARNIQFGNRFCAVFLVHKTGGSKEFKNFFF
jgi:hypothetical protein